MLSPGVESKRNPPWPLYPPRDCPGHNAEVTMLMSTGVCRPRGSGQVGAALLGVHSVPSNLQIGLGSPLPESTGGSSFAKRGVGPGVGGGSGVAVGCSALGACCCTIVGARVGVSPVGSTVTGRGVAVGWAARVDGGASVLGMAVAVAVGAVAGVDVAAGGTGVGEDAPPQATGNNEAPTTASPNTKLRNLMNRC